MGAADAYELLDNLQNAIKMPGDGHDATGNESIIGRVTTFFKCGSGGMVVSIGNGYWRSCYKRGQRYIMREADKDRV